MPKADEDENRDKVETICESDGDKRGGDGGDHHLIPSEKQARNLRCIWWVDRHRVSHWRAFVKVHK